MTTDATMLKMMAAENMSEWSASPAVITEAVWAAKQFLDDIFDKLDALRVEQIVKLVAGDNFGQIFITDTNRDHLDRILKKIEGDYKLFEVENGEVSERKESYEAE